MLLADPVFRGGKLLCRLDRHESTPQVNLMLFLATNFASSGSVGRGAILTYEMIYLGPSQPD
jgi:hypothetical protein